MTDDPLGADPGISESAFLVNASRAKRADLSKDQYAHLWLTDAVEELWDSFSRAVYPYDDVELAVRNRFFLERIEGYLKKVRGSCFVNVAAGFTSYPFLFDREYRCLEIDLEPVIEYKQERLRKWQDTKTLPERSIVMIAADLRDPTTLDLLEGKLRAWMDDRPSFALLEGITYYLEPTILQKILSLLATLQKPGSQLAFDFWDPGMARHPVFQAFQRFFSDRFGFETSDYNLIAPDSLPPIAGYDVIERTNVQEQERVYSKDPVLLDHESILPEHYAILERMFEEAE